MKIGEDSLLTKIQTKKEAIKMIKKCLAVTLAALIIIFNVLPAQAYTTIGTPVVITASGKLSGSVVSMTATVVAQGTTTPDFSKIDFGTASSGVQNSGEAIKITGGTADVDARIVIYTDNSGYFSLPENDPAWDKIVSKPTGIDGAGMPGKTSVPYVVALIWGLNSDPNTNPAYTFNPDLDNSVYVTDVRHAYDFITAGLVADVNTRLGTAYTADQIDTMALYKKDGSNGPINSASEGSDPAFSKLVPTLFWDNLYDSANVSTHKLIREALYRNIATIAFNIRTPDPNKQEEVGYYIADCPKLSTTDPTDNVKVKLAKHGNGTTDAYLYVPIGGKFTGMPWQEYETNSLIVSMGYN